MTIDWPADYLASLVRELCALPRETEWVEFKVNEAQPQAMANTSRRWPTPRSWWVRPSCIWSGACALATSMPVCAT